MRLPAGNKYEQGVTRMRLARCATLGVMASIKNTLGFFMLLLYLLTPAPRDLPEANILQRVSCSLSSPHYYVRCVKAPNLTVGTNVQLHL